MGMGDIKIQNVWKFNWKFLIILDACRYDFFENVYKKYLDGNVRKVYSRASGTLEWVSKVFPDYYKDIIYISANPFINSKIEVIKGDFRFDAKKHFYKVIDVWNFGWDENKGSVHPMEVNKVFFKYLKKYKNYRFVLHYLQPHPPYIGEKYSKYIDRSVLENVKKVKSTTSPEKLDCIRKVSKIEKVVRKFRLRLSNKLFLHPYFEKRVYKLVTLVMPVINKLSINMKFRLYRIFSFFFPLSLERMQLNTILIHEGEKGVRNAYKENLELVLKYVKEVVENVKGKILITSDHGELLGEYGYYTHPVSTFLPENIVPWLEIEKK